MGSDAEFSATWISWRCQCVSAVSMNHRNQSHLDTSGSIGIMTKLRWLENNLASKVCNEVGTVDCHASAVFLTADDLVSRHVVPK
jgi:hypothetical protein